MKAQPSDPARQLPAAMEGVLHEGNAPGVRARFVVEGANGPTTPDGDAVLEDKGVVVVPDILANAGGVVVSYFEWVQALQAWFWTEDEVGQRLEQLMHRAYDEVSTTAAAQSISMRSAAHVIAVGRVADAHRTRGLYP